MQNNWCVNQLLCKATVMWKIGVRKICFVKQLLCESTVVLNYRRAKTLSLEAPVVQNNCHTKYRNWLLCKIWCSERENVGSISPWEKWQCMHAETGSKDPSHINVNFLPTQYIKPSLSQHANCSQTWPAEWKWKDAEVPDLHDHMLTKTYLSTCMPNP